MSEKDRTPEATLSKKTEADHNNQGIDCAEIGVDLYSAIINATRDAIIIVDNDGLICLWNASAEKLFGFTKDEVLGKKVHNLIAPELFHVVAQKGMNQFKETGGGPAINNTLELDARDKDGRQFPIELSLSKIEFDGKHGAIGIVRDISRRKRIEDLKSLALNQITDNVIITDLEGNITYTNDIAAKIENSFWKDVIQQKIAIFNEESEAGVQQQTNNEALRNGIREDVINVAPDGCKCTMGTLTQLVVDKNGNPFAICLIARDITERKLAEENLKESEEKFRTIFNNAGDSIVIHDSKGRFLEVNNEICDRLGYTKEELMNLTPVDIDGPEDAQKVSERISEILQGNTTCFETTHINKNGELLPTEVRGRIISYEGKDAVLVIGRDITERKKSENELRESKERFSTLFNSMTETVALHEIVLDENETPTNYRIVDCNNAYIATTGIERGSAVNQLATVVYETDSPPFFEEYNRVVKTGMPNRFEAYFAPMGKYFDISAVSMGENRFATVITDVTQRKLAEEKLKESEEKYRNILENIEDSYFEVDLKGKFTFFNSSLCKLLEYPKDELLGMSSKQYTDEENAKSLLETFNNVYKTGKATKAFDWKIKTKEGDEKCVEASVSLMLDKDGQPIGFKGIARDVTELKKTQEALLKESRLSAIGEIAGGVAHDINNALQGITFGIESAIINPSDSRENLVVANKLATDAAVRVRQLQRFAGNSREVINYRSTDIKTVIEDSIAQSKGLWKDNAQKKGILIDVQSHCSEDLYIFGDPAELRSVFYNLIKNGIEAMPDGGTINIEASKIGDNININVTDTGMGMDDETKLRIFQPFFSKNKGYEQGRGLGMSNVFSIIKEHKGRIDVKNSQPGKGTTMEITLPYSKKEASHLDEAKIEIQRSARILWVDDEEPIRKMGKNMVEGMKLGQVDIASGGKEALEILEKNQYDLMIIDMAMPGISGDKLAEIIKGKYPGMKIAVLTGYGESIFSEEKKKDLGINFILGKPISMKEVKKLVTNAIQELSE